MADTSSAQRFAYAEGPSAALLNFTSGGGRGACSWVSFAIQRLPNLRNSLCPPPSPSRDVGLTLARSCAYMVASSRGCPVSIRCVVTPLPILPPFRVDIGVLGRRRCSIEPVEVYMPPTTQAPCPPWCALPPLNFSEFAPLPSQPSLLVSRRSDAREFALRRLKIGC